MSETRSPFFPFIAPVFTTLKFDTFENQNFSTSNAINLFSSTTLFRQSRRSCLSPSCLNAHGYDLVSPYQVIRSWPTTKQLTLMAGASDRRHAVRSWTKTGDCRLHKRYRLISQKIPRSPKLHQPLILWGWPHPFPDLAVPELGGELAYGEVGCCSYGRRLFLCPAGPRVWSWPWKCSLSGRPWMLTPMAT